LPRLLAVVCCDDALISGADPADARVTLQRVFFDLYADRFPARVARLVGVLIWSGGEGSYRVGLHISAPDGAAVAAAQGELSASPDLVTNVQLYHFPDLVLPEPGRYAVQVLVDDAPVHDTVLHVVGPDGEVEQEVADGQG